MFKKPLQSGAVRWGIFVLAGALLSFFGVDAEKGEIQNTVDLFNKAWPQIMAVVAAFGIIWGRIKAWRFDVSVFKTSTFWSAVVAGLVGVGQAINLDLGELTSASEVIKNVLPDIMLMVGSMFAIYRRSKATLPILPAGPQNVMAKVADLAVAYAPRYSSNAPYRAIPGLPRFVSWVLGRLSWDSIVAVTGWVIGRLASVTPEQWREVLGWILAAEGMKDMTGPQRWSWVMQKILESFPTWNDLIAKTIASLGLWVLAHEGRIHLKAMDGMPRLGIILPNTDDITNTSRTPL